MDGAEAGSVIAGTQEVLMIMVCNGSGATGEWTLKGSRHARNSWWVLCVLELLELTRSDKPLV